MSLKERYIELKYANGSIYGIPVRVIADDRAKYYEKHDKDTTYQSEFDYVTEDDYEALSWFGNNMDMIDIADHLVMISPPPPFDPLEEDPVAYKIKDGKK